MSMKELEQLRELTQKLTGNGYLKDQTEEWEFALDAIPECVSVVNRENMIKFVNKALKDRLGLEKKDDAYNLSCSDTFECGKGEGNGCECEKHPEEVTTGIRYIKKLNGWFEYTRSPIFSSTKKLIGYILFLRDVSELREAKETAEKYLEVAGVMMLVIGRDQKIKLINRKGCEILEGEEEDIVGKDWFDNFIPEYLHGEIKEVFNSTMGMEIILKPVDEYRNEIITLKGNIKFIEWRNTVIVDAEGKPYVVLCSGADITDRIAAENKIIQQRNTLNSIFDSAPIGIGVVTKKDRTIKFVNQHLLDMFEMEPDDIIERSARVLYPSHAEFARVGKEKHALVDEYGKGSVDTKMQTKSGEVLDVYLSSSRIGQEGDLLFTITDITPVMKITEELELSNERLKILDQVHKMDKDDEESIIEYALEEGERITGSKIAYLHFVEMNGGMEEEDVHLELFRWSKNTMTMCDAKKSRHYPLCDAGIWADPVRQKKPVIHNDYEAETTKKGLPEGHAVLTRHMAVPIMDGDKVVGVAGVGNKDNPYDDNDVMQLSALMNSMWEIIKANRIQARLDLSNERYSMLFNTMLDGFALHEIITDDDGKPIDYRFLEANSAFEELTGLKAEDIIGKTVKEVLPNVERHWIERFGQVAVTGVPVSFNNYSEDFGRWYEVTAYSPAEGQFACIFQDQTENVKASQALKESEVKFRTIFNNHPDPVGIVEIDSQEFVDVNNKFLEYVDLDKEAILGNTTLELDMWVNPDDRDEFYKLLLENKRVENFKTQFKSKDGPIKALVSSNIILLNDRPHLVTIVKNISGI
jgi:PAS domain S-box-containing protein